jgi:hypothetical protein
VEQGIRRSARRRPSHANAVRARNCSRIGIAVGANGVLDIVTRFLLRPFLGGQRKALESTGNFTAARKGDRYFFVKKYLSPFCLC